MPPTPVEVKDGVSREGRALRAARQGRLRQLGRRGAKEVRHDTGAGPAARANAARAGRGEAGQSAMSEGRGQAGRAATGDKSKVLQIESPVVRKEP